MNVSNECIPTLCFVSYSSRTQGVSLKKQDSPFLSFVRDMPARHWRGRCAKLLQRAPDRFVGLSLGHALYSTLSVVGHNRSPWRQRLILV